MEFDFPHRDMLQDKISVLDSDSPMFRNPHNTQHNCEFKLLLVIRQAQGLRTPVTSVMKFRHSSQKLYVYSESMGDKRKLVKGFLKVGKRRLFLYDSLGHVHDTVPLCVLDFYVHESVQRRGVGKKLFDFMLLDQQCQVEHIAIDRPSKSMVAFVKRHYKLTNALHQANNFLIFEEFFRLRY